MCRQSTLVLMSGALALGPFCTQAYCLRSLLFSPQTKQQVPPQEGMLLSLRQYSPPSLISGPIHFIIRYDSSVHNFI